MKYSYEVFPGASSHNSELYLWEDCHTALFHSTVGNQVIERSSDTHFAVWARSTVKQQNEIRFFSFFFFLKRKLPFLRYENLFYLIGKSSILTA